MGTTTLPGKIDNHNMSRPVERKKSWWASCCSCCSSNQGEDLEDYAETAGGGNSRPTDRPRDPEASGSNPDRSGGDNNYPLDNLPSGEISRTALQIQSVDLLKSRNGENRRSHHTSDFEYDNLILRRGQPFQIALTCKRAFNPRSDQITIILQMANGHPVTLSMVKEFEEDGWGCQVSDVSGEKVVVWVNTSAQAPIGKYQICVKTNCPGGAYSHPPDANLNLYLLFNPWCRLDAVFMDNDAWLQEYVLNENGRIYYGTEHQIGERSWNYGQFDPGVLDSVMYVLDRCSLSPTARSDPITVTRGISALVNSMDDNGVIAGSWADEYTDGTNPVAWTGSVDILIRFHKTGHSVKYGQCWVFAGVTTTVLRCLGIPGRTITNFASAHDTDRSLTFDVYFDGNMKPLEDKNSDSVWNYHCWNDCWMTRPDLPSGYSGWQAIDSTPQETSSGIYCCGPSPLLAIKNGLVNIKYDTPFLFAEVNCDKVFYQQMPNGEFKKVHVEERAIGHCISTKAVGSYGRQDITNMYKYPEGSAEERNSVRTAAQYGNITMPVAEPLQTDDVVLTVDSQDGVLTGSDINVRVTLKNCSSSRRSVSLTMCVAAMYYNGVCKESFKKDTREVVINPGDAKAMGMLVSYKEYRTEVVDQGAMMLTVSGIVQETGQKIAKQHIFRLKTNDLVIKVLGDVVVGQQISAEITFTNPLPITLHNASFRVEGPGLQRPKIVPVGEIGPGKTVCITENFTPQRDGPRQLIASLESDELNQVNGVCELNVRGR